MPSKHLLKRDFLFVFHEKGRVNVSSAQQGVIGEIFLFEIFLMSLVTNDTESHMSYLERWANKQTEEANQQRNKTNPFKTN